MELRDLYLVDGYALIYRAYFALLKNPLSNRNGIPTGAFYGFASYLLRLLESYNCPYLAVVMDSPKPTFRHLMYDKYKANREAMPDDLKTQLPFIRQFIDACNIPTVIQEGLEADDLIASLTHKAVDAGFNVFVVTRDKDLMQLVGPNVTMLAPEGAGVLEPLRENDVLAKMGVPPGKIVDYLSLIGDASDNIPGVPGVGPKTAIKILEQVASVEALLADTSVIANPKLKQKIDDNRHLLELSKRLVTLKTDTPIIFTLDELVRKPVNRDACTSLIRDMECTSLLKFAAFVNIPQEDQVRSTVTVADMSMLDGMAAEIISNGSCAIFPFAIGSGRTRRVTGVAIATEESRAWYLSLHHDVGQNISAGPFSVFVNSLAAAGSLRIIWHNVKNDYSGPLGTAARSECEQFDCMIVAYLLDPGKRDYSIPALSEQWQHTSITMPETLCGSGKTAIETSSIPVADASRLCGIAACTLFALEKKLRPLLFERKLRDLFVTMELPLVNVLADMETHGIRIDLPFLRQLSQEYTGRLETVSAEIYRLAGEEFNINSPKQLGDILFDKLHLPAPKRTKTGAHATGVEILEKLAPQFPIVRSIMDHRELQKLLSTYIDALPLYTGECSDRVHTQFNQTIAATGRLSSTDPNLQNIPIRTEDGKRIRDAFIPAEGTLLVSADYSQIELRILAHLSDDPLLKQAFAEDKDIHTQTASAIYGIFPEMVTPEMRRAAKTINFGLMYGMGPINLSNQLGISFTEARAFIETYFCQFPTIKRFMESTIEGARKHGYVETLHGRRRYLPDINASNRNIREAAERTAINTPVQGTAADIIKIAMINIARLLPSTFTNVKMLLQVHDELVFEVPSDAAEPFRTWVCTKMSEAFTLSVPLKVEAGIGRNWNQAH